MSTRSPAGLDGLRGGISRASLLLVPVAGGNFQETAVSGKENTANLRRVEGTRAHATGDGDLVPGFVHVTIATLAARQRHRLATGRKGRNQFWLRLWSKSQIPGRVGIDELHNPHTVVAVGNISEITDVGASDGDVVNVIQRSAG